MDHGITAVFGDNPRVALQESGNEFWPSYSTGASNGCDGLVLVGRWHTRIYFDCDLPSCDLKEWVATFASVNDWQTLLYAERTTSTRFLLAPRQDSFMFHQPNLRVADVPTVTVGSVTGELSMLQSWVETVTQEMTRWTNWSLVSLRHDDLATKLINGRIRHTCAAKGQYVLSTDRESIAHIVVSASDANCAASMPVTVPWAATAEGGAIVELDKVGVEPIIDWVSLRGKPVTLSLWEALQV